MAKKLIRIALIIFILLIPFVSISLIVKNNMMRFMDQEYSWYAQNKDYMEHHKEYTRILIIGDSVSKVGWIPKKLSVDSYNYALGGVSPIETYYYLKEYLENNKKPKYVIYTQGIDHFIVAERLWDRSIYFHRLSGHSLDEIIHVCNKYNDKTILDGKSKIDSFLYEIYSPSKYGTAFCNGLLSNKRKNENIIKYKEAVKNKGQVWISSGNTIDKENDFARNKEFKQNEVIDYYFRRIIKLCEKNNISLIYQSPPLNKVYYKKIKERFKKQYMLYMEKMQKEFPNVLIDYSIFSYDSNNFEDTFHLNKRGALRFSKEMKKKYKNIFKE